MKLIIQIPCLNEELTLPDTLADLPKHIEGVEYKTDKRHLFNQSIIHS
ncbi:MAG: hypothetical protein HOC23_20635 [Halieaceae bacterium]|nr:hypothetical protein [Halieaceae bacterium]